VVDTLILTASIVKADCGKRLYGTEVACRGLTRLLDDFGGIKRDSCLTKRGPVQGASGLEHNARLREKDTLKLGSGTSNNLSGDLPKDIVRLGSTRKRDDCTGSNGDVLGDLEDPDVSISAAKGDTAGESHTGTPLVEAGSERQVLNATFSEFRIVRVHATRSISVGSPC